MEICYKPTSRNRPTLEILEKSNLLKIKTNQFKVNIEKGYEKPALVALHFLK